MSNIDKQAVQAVADLKAGYTLGHADVAILNELARIALASLEAKSRKLFTCSGCGAEGLDEPLESKCHCNEDGAHWVEGVVYSAPPAPVSVPEIDRKAIANKVHSKCSRIPGVTFYNAAEFAIDEIEAHRDAMLQGAEPVTTAYKLPFEQWLSQQTGTIDVECGCVMTEVFFHWLRVAYEAGNSQAIPDGWKLVPIELTGDMTNAMSEAILDDLHNVDVWRSVLAAAPKQEA